MAGPSISCSRKRDTRRDNTVRVRRQIGIAPLGPWKVVCRDNVVPDIPEAHLHREPSPGKLPASPRQRPNRLLARPQTHTTRTTSATMAAASMSRLSRRASASAGPFLRRILYSTATASPSPAASSPPLPPAAAAAAGADRVRWDYRGQRQLVPLGQWLPKVAVDAYVAPEAVLAGQVTVHDGASVWSGSVLRGDLNKITLGFCANVQERCVLHAAWSAPTGHPPSLRSLLSTLCSTQIWQNITLVLG
jgi:hypothetical protein